MIMIMASMRMTMPTARPIMPMAMPTARVTPIPMVTAMQSAPTV
jgi:hypothetical protein